MDNLKKVLTNRTELAGNLYKYTNVVKGKIKIFCFAIYCFEFIRCRIKCFGNYLRLPVALLPSGCRKWHFELLLIGECRRSSCGQSQRHLAADGGIN